jgi:hypothetical protein
VRDALSKNLIEERIDIAFRSAPDTDLRALPARTWRMLLDEPPGKKISTFTAPSFEVHLIGETSLLVFQRRVVIKSSRGALDGALALLWRQKEAKLERLIYQRQGYQQSTYGGLREGLARLRSEAGERLGAAVVVGETALFHPPPHCKRLGERHASVRMIMGHLASRIENALHVSNVDQRQAAFKLLELDSAVGSPMSIEGHGPSHTTMMWAVGESIASLHLLKKASATFAVFEYDGAIRANLNLVTTRVLAALAPRDLQIEALHASDAQALPGLAGAHWELHPLGASESLSLLTPSKTGNLHFTGRSPKAAQA